MIRAWTRGKDEARPQPAAGTQTRARGKDKHQSQGQGQCQDKAGLGQDSWPGQNYGGKRPGPRQEFHEGPGAIGPGARGSKKEPGKARAQGLQRGPAGPTKCERNAASRNGLERQGRPAKTSEEQGRRGRTETSPGAGKASPYFLASSAENYAGRCEKNFLPNFLPSFQAILHQVFGSGIGAKLHTRFPCQVTCQGKQVFGLTSSFECARLPGHAYLLAGTQYFFFPVFFQGPLQSGGALRY
jgi:hypothetical protein